MGGGIGGTADYNTFQYASENNDASASITKLMGKHEISTGFEYHEAILQRGPAASALGFLCFRHLGNGPDGKLGGRRQRFCVIPVGHGNDAGHANQITIPTSPRIFSRPRRARTTRRSSRTHTGPTQNLTITAGLRWDIFGGKTERHNRLEYFNPTAAGTASGVSYTGAEIYASSSNRSPFATNLKNFGPRLGFSWQPATRLVIRGGGGFYYGPSAQMVGGTGLDSDGFSSQTTWNATAWNQDPNTNAWDCANANVCSGDQGNTTLISSLSNPFPNGVVPTITAPTGLANNLGNSFSTMLHSQRTPTTYNFNFGVEYELPHQVVFSAGYVGSRGLFLPLGTLDLNQLDLGTIAQNQDALLNASVPNQWAAIQSPTNANYGSPTVPLWVSLQEFPQFGNGNYGSGNGVIVHGYPGGDSEYSSLQTKVQKRLTHTSPRWLRLPGAN